MALVRCVFAAAGVREHLRAQTLRVADVLNGRFNPECLLWQTVSFAVAMPRVGYEYLRHGRNTLN